MKTSVRLIVLTGLVLGAVLGMAGTMVDGQPLRAVLWAIDGTGLIVATSLLALAHFRAGNDLAAGGFVVYAIGEAVMLGGTAMTPDASVPTFAAGAALWAASLGMTAVGGEFPVWSRAASLIGAVLFAIVALRDFAGQMITPLNRPLPFFAYPFLVLSFVGWGVWVMRRSGKVGWEGPVAGRG
jgi:hypothetical protein